MLVLQKLKNGRAKLLIACFVVTENSERTHNILHNDHLNHMV
jgi:hypothetical protein